MKREEIEQYMLDSKATFIGWHPVPCPVYVIHVEYDSVDSDPFYPIYKSIAQYIELDPLKQNFSYFSNLIGFDSNLMDYCFRILKEEGMIIYAKDKYMLTEDARRKYVYPNSRSVIKVTSSFLIDGKSLKLLPNAIYKNRQELGYWDTNISAHEPIDPQLNPAPYEKIIKLLNDGTNKSLLHLESDGSNFQILCADRRYLKEVNILYYYTAEYILHKDIVYNGKQMNTAALGAYNKFTIDMAQLSNSNNEWTFKGNLGYNAINSEEDSIDKVVLKTQNDGWTYILTNRYKLSSNEILKVITEEKTKLPIIHISESNLLNSKNTIQILKDCNIGYVDFSVLPKGKVRIQVQHNLQLYVDFLNIIETWDSTLVSGIEFRKILESKYKSWRKMLILLCKYTELENIDCDCYIRKH